MNKNIIITFLILFLSLKLSAQMDLNEIANEQYHKIAQIEGTEDILINYFSKIKNQNDDILNLKYLKAKDMLHQHSNKYSR